MMIDDQGSYVEKIAALESELAQLRLEQQEWNQVKQSAMEIIRFDETLSKQSNYWRSMLLSLVEGLSVPKEIMEQHIDFEIKLLETGEPVNIYMQPKTVVGTKLIQVWGVMDMLKELIEGFGLKGVVEQNKEKQDKQQKG